MREYLAFRPRCHVLPRKVADHLPHPWRLPTVSPRIPAAAAVRASRHARCVLHAVKKRVRHRFLPVVLTTPEASRRGHACLPFNFAACRSAEALSSTQCSYCHRARPPPSSSLPPSELTKRERCRSMGRREEQMSMEGRQGVSWADAEVCLSCLHRRWPPPTPTSRR